MPELTMVFNFLHSLSFWEWIGLIFLVKAFKPLNLVHVNDSFSRKVVRKIKQRYDEKKEAAAKAEAK